MITSNVIKNNLLPLQKQFEKCGNNNLTINEIENLKNLYNKQIDLLKQMITNKTDQLNIIKNDILNLLQK